MNITKKMLKEGPQFKVLYHIEDGGLAEQTAYSEEANTAFFDALPLIGSKSATAYKKQDGVWLPYKWF